MSIEAQEQAARAILQGIAAGRIDRSLLAPDFVFASDLVADMDGATFAAGVEQTGRACRTPMTMRIDEVIARPGRIAVQAESHADLITGRHYNNRYFWLIRFNDRDQITLLREYCDTHLAREVLWSAFAMLGGLDGSKA
jgi:ketosteroid isomerase-like protein